MVASPAHPSFWLANLDRPPLPPVEDLPASAEVIVIGGGMTGVSTAYWLSSLGLQTLLLEREDLACGATGRNGGHIMAGASTHFAASIQSLGLAKAMAILTFLKENFRSLQEFIQRHKIACDFVENDLVTLAINDEQAQTLQQAYEVMAPYGLATAFWDAATVARQTHSSVFPAAIVRPQHGQFWPAKLVVAIAQIAAQQGAQIATQTSVSGITRSAQRLTVETNRGAVQAGAVVYATNAFTHHLLPELRGVIVPVRGQAIATRPVPRLWNFDWSANDGYEYTIQRADGRIIFGGMRWHSPTQEVNVEDVSTIEPHVSQNLRAFLQDAFADLKEVPIEYEWTGIMGFTPDENPLVGELPHRPNEYIAAGFTGQGMSFGFMTGQRLAEAIAGRTGVEIPEAFAPERFMPLMQPGELEKGTDL